MTSLHVEYCGCATWSTTGNASALREHLLVTDCAIGNSSKKTMFSSPSSAIVFRTIRGVVLISVRCTVS